MTNLQTMSETDYHHTAKFCDKSVLKAVFSKRKLMISLSKRRHSGDYSLDCSLCGKQLPSNAFSNTQLKGRKPKCKECINNKQISKKIERSQSIATLHEHCIGKDLFTELKFKWPTRDCMDDVDKLQILINIEECYRDVFIYKDTIIIASNKLDLAIRKYHFDAFDLLTQFLKEARIDYEYIECVPILYYRGGSISCDGVTFVLENDTFDTVHLADFIGNYNPKYQKMFSKKNTSTTDMRNKIEDSAFVGAMFHALTRKYSINS